MKRLPLTSPSLLVGCLLLALASQCSSQCSTPTGQPRCVLSPEDERGGSPVFRELPAIGRPAERLPDGWEIEVLETERGWHRIRYMSPLAPEGDSTKELGWIRDRFVGTCSGHSPAIDAQEASAEPERPVTICWWQTDGLGRGERDLDLIARVLEQCDVVGLGSILSRGAPVELSSKLGRSWSSLVSDAIDLGSDGGDEERFAIVFDRAVVDLELADQRGTLGFAPVPAAAAGQAVASWAVPLRSPSSVFTVVLHRADRSLVTASPERAFHRLSGALGYFRGHHEGRSSLIVMGDFIRELKPGDTGLGVLRELGLQPVLRDGAATLDEDGGARRLTDNILVTTADEHRWTGQSGVMSPGDTSLGEFRERVGSHLPIWARFGEVLER